MMNIIEYFSFEKEYTMTIYGLWKKAVMGKDYEVRKTLNLGISLCVKHCLMADYPTTGFRARIVYPKDYSDIILTERKSMFEGSSGLNGFPASKSGAPPKNASPGRANKKNKSVLYLASDAQTACSEVQPSCDALISVAKFTIRNGLKIIDLRELPVEFQTITNYDKPENIKNSIILGSIIEFFRMPVNSNELDLYRYSQYVIGRLRMHRIDGVIYQSSHNQNDGAYNIVLFAPHNASCVSEYGDLYICKSIKSSFQNISVNSTEQTVRFISAERTRAPFLWNEAAVFFRDLKNATKQKGE